MIKPDGLTTLGHSMDSVVANLSADFKKKGCW
jgi:hypothetical protein